MPALTPTAVGLSPLASAAVMNATAAGSSAGELNSCELQAAAGTQAYSIVCWGNRARSFQQCVRHVARQDILESSWALHQGVHR